MAKKRGTRRSGAPAGKESRLEAVLETYDGHEIIIVPDDPGRRVLLDDEPLRYGRVGDEFYLDAYAYDRDTSLLEVVKRYVDHRKQATSRLAAEGER